jgi:signal peptidase II
MASMKAPVSRIALFFAIAAIGCAADLATKSWIFGRLGMPYTHQPLVLVPGIFSLTTSLNEGALFGMGQGMTLVFACLSLLAAAGIFYWLIFAGAARDLGLTFALGFIMAGICGNLYDRLGLPGLVWHAPDPREGLPVYAVRDWLHFQIQSIGFDWAVFNLADSMLVVGACMLFLHVAWREGRQKPSVSASESAA